MSFISSYYGKLSHNKIEKYTPHTDYNLFKRRKAVHYVHSANLILLDNSRNSSEVFPFYAYDISYLNEKIFLFK